MDKDKYLKLLARQLAKFYGNGKNIGACACSGLEGMCIFCPIWWEMFLKKYSDKDVAKMYTLYELVKEINNDLGNC